MREEVVLIQLFGTAVVRHPCCLLAVLRLSALESEFASRCV